MLKKTFLPTEKKNEQMALQITSMADIFVIILVFLLKTYSIEGLPYQPKAPLNLPTAQGRIEKSESLKVEISKSALVLGGQNVAAMNQFRFPHSDVDGDGASQVLRRALSRTHSKRSSEKLIVVADEGAPYETIKTVLASAAIEGYQDIQLAVSHAQ